MDLPVPPAILVVGHAHAGRMELVRILSEAGFDAAACEAIREKVRAAAAQAPPSLILAVGIEEAQGRRLFKDLPAAPASAASPSLSASPAPPPVYYLALADEARPDPALRPAELVANVRTFLRLHAEAADARCRLHDEERHKEEFLAMLAHELRNPLAPILNAAHVIRLHAPSNDTLLWAIGMVERQTRHLTHLVDDLLDVSRINGGRIELHRELVTLRAVMQNVAEAARAFVGNREHQFLVELPTETLWLDADPTRLEQILLNLLNNAAKYTPRGGQVLLSGGREAPSPGFPQGAAVIRVRDSGIGIEPEMLSRVFEVFSQADRSLDRAEGGLGLGLTLVRRLAELHGGRAEAHSAGLGQGAEFVVRLPLVPLAPDTFEAQPFAAERPAEFDTLYHGGPGQSRRILVVDDQVDTVQSLAELLGIWGHEVRVGFDGPTAVELALNYHPDVVLLDIGLPLMNGYEVARRLRQSAGPELLLVALTGYGQDEDRRRALEAGFDLHMTKPVDLEALRGLLASATRI